MARGAGGSEIISRMAATSTGNMVEFFWTRCSGVCEMSVSYGRQILSDENSSIRFLFNAVGRSGAINFWESGSNSDTQKSILDHCIHGK